LQRGYAGPCLAAPQMTRSLLPALLLLLLVPAGAPAAVTVGSSLPEPSGDTVACLDPGGCTFVPTRLSGAPVAVPFDGVVVSWATRHRSDGLPDPIDMRILRPAPGGELTAVGPSTSLPPSADGTVRERRARIPVRAGDLIAVDLDEGEEVGVVGHADFDSASSVFAPRLGSAETRAPTDEGEDDFEYLFNARVEPDADGDGAGDETQDQCPQLAETTSVCRRRLSAVFAHGASMTILEGDEVQTRVTVRNLPRGSAADVVLRVIPPPELDVTAPGAPCAAEAGAMVCRLGTLASGASASVDLRLRALPRTPGSFRPNAIPSVLLRAELAGPFPLGPTMAVRILAAGACRNPFAGRPSQATTVSGTFAGDRMLGTPRREVFRGGAGDDCLVGGLGNDLLRAGEGDDRLSGGGGPDSLYGDAGRDRLAGGGGPDRLLGGAGADLIRAVDGRRDLVRCGAGRDRVWADAVDSVAGCERVRRIPRGRRSR
jgi:RTX calcium-binding nonapeptide repeat (4 copies)